MLIGIRFGLLPDHPQPVRSNPLVLFLYQRLLAAHAEQAIKTVLRLEQLRFLDVEDGGDFAVAIQAFLVGASQTDQADDRDQGEADLQGQSDRAVEQFLTGA